MELPDTEPSLESTSEDNTYSGTATFLYSSKITGNVNLEGMCEILAESDAFSFALTSSGKIYFTEDNRLRSQQLSIEPTITEQGMTVSGHNDFLKATPETLMPMLYLWLLIYSCLTNACSILRMDSLQKALEYSCARLPSDAKMTKLMS
ncbi:hypothetical protein [Pseudomonas chlororaphis]|uniref:hypothetical protein n=1 Tax=Pseudomonas chlororaphis TaxID=587753 RepID=UPI001560C318|nr:hypothetical protein [Pseudomonas chlororaphis]